MVIITTKNMVGESIGMVIFLNIEQLSAPSIFAASYMLFEIELIDDKKNAELNAKDRYFRIEENEEEKENGNKVPNDADDLDTNENDNSLKN